MPLSARFARVDRFARIVGVFLAALVTTAPVATAQDAGFPYDRELLLDANPMPGSKRVPSIQVSGNGSAVIDLWCTSARGQFVFAGDTLTIIIGPLDSQSCTPEREAADGNLVNALTQVTNWRRQGQVVELIGTTSLRYRLQTN